MHPFVNPTTKSETIFFLNMTFTEDSIGNDSLSRVTTKKTSVTDVVTNGFFGKYAKRTIIQELSEITEYFLPA